MTREAGRSITVTDFTEGKARAVCTTVPKELQSLSPATTVPLAGMKSLVVRAKFVRARFAPALPAQTAGPLATMPSPAARATFTPTLSAASAMAVRSAAIRLAGAPASAAEAVFTVADGAEGTQLSTRLLFNSHIQNWRTTRCDKPS
jgi:hypothetical protein